MCIWCILGSIIFTHDADNKIQIYTTNLSLSYIGSMTKKEIYSSSFSVLQILPARIFVTVRVAALENR